MTKRGTDTRELIRVVALEMFAERGYERAALREIAERLGVTKAAVYHHFTTKEEILASLVGELDDELTELLGWARSRPNDQDTTREVLHRYARLLAGRHGRLVSFLQQSQSSVRGMSANERLQARFVELADLLVPAERPLADRLRARLSLVALHLAAGRPLDVDAREAERREAALQVALELVEHRPVEPS